ncbi:MAG: hypothetical protein H0U60_13170 [Blastocatellia bacterium]|nr:hypothetical protein [Blastocatellia bacterium]
MTITTVQIQERISTLFALLAVGGGCQDEWRQEAVGRQLALLRDAAIGLRGLLVGEPEE